MRTLLYETVHDLTPIIYEVTKEQLSMHPYADMSRSNRCHNLTLNLLRALDGRHIEARRELHKTSGGLWHYVIAHAPISAPPTETDIITDLNPWQFDDNPSHSGLLHAERHEVQAVLATEGAPEWFVSLRGLSTIAEAHTEVLTPFAKS
ncbi:MAG TPA: hypothetical protein VGO07_01335 [Candidatus Saccharimonadales bacterium]|jgi:hypothetical protein|nr:hypothetical protein [Candidatus Saccharimonadales bacterium]